MRIFLHIFLISCLPFAVIAGFTAITMEVPALGPSVGPLAGLYQATAAVDGKIDRIDLIFDDLVNGAQSSDFEVVGYQISTVVSNGSKVVTLNLINGDVQDTGATPLVKFFPGRLVLALNTDSKVSSGLLVDTAIARDGAAPVLDILNGQAMHRPRLTSDSVFTRTPDLGLLFMSFSERVTLGPDTFLRLENTDSYCSDTMTNFTPVDAATVNSTAHIVTTLLCVDNSDPMGRLALSDPYLTEFAATVVDESNLRLTWRAPGNELFWTFWSQFGGVGWGGGATFDEARMNDLISNLTVCNRSSFSGQTFICAQGLLPVMPRVIASSLDIDGNGKIDTIQVRTIQNRVDYINRRSLSGYGIGNATHTLMKSIIDRSSVRIDTLVPNSTLSSWSLPGFTINNASYERGRILLRVTELPSFNSSGVDVNLNYAGGTLTTWTGNLLNATAVVVEDRACPVILSAKAMGGSNNLYIQFSEPVKNVLSSSFIIASGPLGNHSFLQTAVLAVIPNGTNIYMATVNVPFTYRNFGSSALSPYRVSGLSTIDQSALPSCPLRRSYVPLTSLDMTPPSVVSVFTRDNNANGKIDGFSVVFNKNVTISTLNVSEFTADGFPGLRVITTTDSNIVEFSVTESLRINTSLTTQFRAAAPTLVDLSNNLLAPFNVTTIDGVGAYPLALRTGNSYASNPTGQNSFFFDKIIIDFSEPVNCSSLLITDFSAMAAATPTISPVQSITCSPPTSSSVTLNFTPVRNQGGSRPQVVFRQFSGKDSLNNLIPSWTLNATDGINPICGVTSNGALAAFTVDTMPNSTSPNGKVDTVILNCLEQVQNVKLWSFSLSGYNITNATADAQCPSGFSFCLILSVQENLNYDTDATPTITYNASSAITDTSGNSLLVPAPLVALDSIPPVLVSAMTKDANADGKIDSFQLQFSEELMGTSFTLFSIPSYLVSTGSISGSTLTLIAAAVSNDYDGGATPSIIYNTPGGNIEDVNNNRFPISPSPFPSVDGVFPIVLNASTAGDCKLASIKISMNENINLASVNKSSFNISGYTILNVTLGNVLPFGFSLEVAPNSRLVPDIVLPNVSYGSPLTISDNGRNPMVAFNMSTLDRLAPCMVACFSRVGSSSIAIQFSEPVVTGPASANLALNNFDLRLSSNGLVNSTVVNSSFYYLAVNRSFIETDITFGSEDTKASLFPINVRDVNMNNAVARCLITNNDFTPPTLLSAKTVNTDNLDAQVDRILLTFDEPISDASMNISDWAVSGYTIIAFSTGSVANDERIFLVLTPLSIPDTDATPNITYTKPAMGGFADRNRNLFASNQTVAIDAAQPILVSFQAIILAANGSNIAFARFSEPVYGPGLLTNANFKYTSTNGNAASIASFSNANGANRMVVMSLNTLALIDFNADSVTANVTDAANNPSVNASVLVTKGDARPPVLIDAVTGDVNMDGQIDHLTVTFNESMLGSSLAANTFSLGSYVLTNMVVNDYMIEFNVAQLTILDGAATPTFTYTPGVATDLNGNFLVSFSRTSTDGVAPFLVDCSSTLPALRTIDCVFSEPVVGSAADFVIGGPLGSASVASVIVASSTSSITLTLDRTLLLRDFKNNGTIDVRANSSLADLSSNIARPRPVFLRNTDITPPTLINASTRDRDCNGRIDAIELIFNEGIIDESLMISNFQVGIGYVVIGKDTGAQPDDSSIFLNITESTESDTDASGFSLIYTPGSLTDLSENMALSFSVSVLDGSGVALLSVVGDVDSPYVNLNFSSPFSANNALIDLVLQNFSVQSSSLTDADGSDSTLRLMLNGNLKPRDFARPATVFPRVLDLSNNYACPKAIPLTNPDKTIPTIISVATGDADSDGHIDSFIFTCSKPIDEESLRTADFSVAGYSVIGVNGSSTPSNSFTLFVAERNTTDVSHTPLVTYAGASLADRYGNKLATTASIQSVDRIGPSIIRATGSGSSLILLFSKAIYNSTNGTLFNFSDISYFANASSTPNAITSIMDKDGSDSTLSLGMSRAFVRADFGVDAVEGTSSIRDAKGNMLNPVRVFITQPETVPENAAASPGLDQTTAIAIGAGVGGGVLLLILIVVIVVCYKQRKCCFKDKASGFDQDQIANEFDFGSTQTEMVAKQAAQSSLPQLGA